MHFGEHLMIDGYGGDRKKLKSKGLVLRCLNELTTELGMKKIAPPLIAWAEPNGKKDPGGWSGVLLIAESHVSIHTFPPRGFLSADVYSCKSGIDTKRITAYLTEKFGLRDIEQHFVKRGRRYPKKNLSA